MNKQRLLQLMDTIQAGELSRNRHFEAYLDPEVREAKQRQLRLKALAELLLLESDAIQVAFEKAACGSSWLMDLKVIKWRLRWRAKLLDVEMVWLQKYPPTATYMTHLMAAV